MARDRQAGFTLLETIVALMVFALVAAALQLCLAGGWKGVRLVRMEQTALMVAKAQLAAAGVESILTEGTAEGSTPDGFHWTRDIRRYEPVDGDGAEASAIAGYWVNVSVSWRVDPFRPERSVQLTTLKLGRGG